MCESELLRGNVRDIYHHYNCYFRTALFCFNYLSFLQEKSEKFNMTTIYVTIKHINATKVLSECTHCLFGKHALFDSCVLVIKKISTQEVFISSVVCVIFDFIDALLCKMLLFLNNSCV